MIEVINFTKRYGDFVAVDDLSFTIGQGEVFGFIGPNGAGKSTTIRFSRPCSARPPAKAASPAIRSSPSRWPCGRSSGSCPTTSASTTA